MAELIYAGKWFGQARRAISAAADVLTARCTGEIGVRLYKGTCSVETRKSPYSLYNAQIASFEGNELYDQSDAKGFIRLFSLTERLASSFETGGNNK